MKNKRKKLSKKAIHISLITILFIICCILINMSLYNFDDRSLHTSLKELSSYNRQFFDDIMDGHYNALKHIDAAISYEEDVFSPAVSNRIESMLKTTQFTNVIVYDETGTGYVNGVLVGNFADEVYFTEAIRGRSTVDYADTYYRDSLRFCIPLTGENKVIGAVCGLIPISNINRQLGELGANINNMFLTDDNMNVLFRKESAQFSIDTADIVRVKTAMKSHENLTVATQLNGKQVLLSCEYLGVNNWYALSYILVKRKLLSVMIFLNACLIGAFVTATIMIERFWKYQNNAHQRVLEKTRNETYTLAKSIPGGAFSCLVDENLSIKSYNQGLLQLLECTAEELVYGFGNKFLDMIHEDDVNEFMYLYNKNYNTYMTFEYSCRLKRKDQSIVWVFGKSQFTRDIDDNLVLYTVLIDNTDQKNTESKLRLSEERYKILLEQSKSIIFEYNIINQENFVTPNFYEMFGVAARNIDMFTLFLRENRIYESDIPMFDKILDSVYFKHNVSEAELRIRDASGKHRWYLLRMTAMLGIDGTPIRSVGNLTDIDAQKRSTQSLMVRAQMDGLTGCYNKATTTAMITQFLEDEELQEGALAIIDVDYFKSINDSLGHSVGDSVLEQIGERLREQVRSSDIVGRIGGDEFVVFLKHTSNDNQIISRIQAIMDDLHTITLTDSRHVTASVGVAIFPKHAKEYCELFIKADEALYLSKTHGRDMYTILE